jgi:hypothetical protein
LDNKIETEGEGASAGLNNSKGSIFKTEANFTILAGEIHLFPFSISLRKFIEISSFSANSACVHFL